MLMQMMTIVQISFLIKSSKSPLFCDCQAVLSISRLEA